MNKASFKPVEDATRSLVRGPALTDEAGLGSLTLPGFLSEVTQRFGAREALVQTIDGVVERWSYSGLWDRATAVAKALVAQGLGKGERVGILTTNRAEFLSALFGTVLAGGVAAPFSTFSTRPELDHLLASSGCSILLFERAVLKKDFVDMLGELEPLVRSVAPDAIRSLRYPYLRFLATVDGEATGAIASWRDFLARGESVSDAAIAARMATVAPADPGLLFFSSGSTNRPKGILSAHRGVAIQMWRMARQQDLDDGVRSWTANGFFWSGNFAMVVGATLASGGSLVLQRTFQAEDALALMQAERVSFPFAWPHQWAQLTAAANWASIDLSSLRHVDAQCPLARHPTVETAWIEPRHCYGNTETFTLSTGYPAGTLPGEANESHGPVLAGNILKIVDPLSGAIVPVGERGEIAIKGPTLMLGYLGVPLDETLDEEGFFRTGDGGHVDMAGRLFWAGRLSDIIKTGGANVSPLEIDEVIRGIPGVKIAQTVGVPDEALGELVVTCIVAQPAARLDEASIRAFARERLASFKVPRRVLFFAESELGLTGSAKIKTADLRQRVARKLAGQAAA